MLARLLPLLLTCLASAGCDLPRDPEHTTDRMRERGALRVGLSENPPWVRFDKGNPAGIEPTLIRAFARSQGVRVEWTRSGESALFKALEDHRLDVVAGGLLGSTPWKAQLGLSQPYQGGMMSEQHVLATPPGENQLLLRLDRFLVEQKPRIAALVGTETTR